MSTESYRVMERYLTEVAIEGRLEVIDELAQPDMVDEANAAFGGPAGRAGLVAHVKGFRRHVRDAELKVHRIVAGEQEVMAWWSFRGTHAGPWLGREPTGNRITGTVFSFFELRGGLVSRYRLWLHARFPEDVIFDSSDPQDTCP